MTEALTAASVLGRTVVAERERQGLTQIMLADKVQLSLSSIQKIEQGKANPTLSAMIQLARGLNISLAHLIRGVDAVI